MNGGVPAAHLRPTAGARSGDAVLGIRPRHVEWEPASGTVARLSLPGVVNEVDDTGDDALIYAEVGEETVRILETRGRKVAVGDAILVRFPEAAVHLFADGKRVELEGVVQPTAVV
jgi:ABC-type sugar transport system ATPase subunit